MFRPATALSAVATFAALGAVAVLTASACQKAPEAPTERMAPSAPAGGGAASVMATAAPVRYRVEFTPLWTKANFPFDYPDTSLIHKPHFSGLIGAAHDGSVVLFREGQMPTPGLERLSEEGKHQPLDAEIGTAVAAGRALGVIESGPLKDFSQTVATEFAVDAAHSRVSLVAMIAPSPDWFVGVADIDLLDMGAFTGKLEVDGFAWDSGGDAGITFLADDVDTSPKLPSALSADRRFKKDGKTMPVGRFVFTRL
jgi:hypothetical protein